MDGRFGWLIINQPNTQNCHPTLRQLDEDREIEDKKPPVQVEPNAKHLRSNGIRRGYKSTIHSEV